MTFKSFISDLLVIVVLYKKRISEVESIQSIATSLKGFSIDIFVYDNSPEFNSPNPEIIENCNIHYEGDPENSGVSKAYNMGSSFAKSKKKKWLILCDQDTLFKKTYFESLFKVIQEFMPPMIAPYLYSNSVLISPCTFTFNYGRLLKEVPLPGWTDLNRKALLNSGLVINTDVFEMVGGYDENVFLDFSDFDFIKKFKNKYGRFYLMNVSLEHHLESSFQGSFNEQRFIKYCKSYRNAIHNLFDLVSISLIVFARTMKLSYKYKTLSPIRYWIFNFIIKRY